MMINSIYVFIFLLLKQCAGKYISLNSNDWTLTDQLNQYVVSNVSVPGGLYTDLLSAGIIDDPLYDKNDINYRHFSKLNWTWSKLFNLEHEDLKSNNEVYLIAEGIDTVSNIYLNENLIGITKNMFVRNKFEISRYLKPGSNLIKIEIQSPVDYAKSQFDSYKANFNYSIVPECWPDVYNGECHANFIRKMAASFSWDWGPAFPSSGIWLPIGIEILESTSKFDKFWATCNESNNGDWIINLTLNLERPVTGKQFDVQVTLSTDDDSFETEFIIYRGSLTSNSSVTNYILPSIFVGRSRVGLWWPNGMMIYSEDRIIQRSRTLYNLTVNLSNLNDSVSQSKTKRIGFRSIKLVQEKPSAGKIKSLNGEYQVATMPGLSFRFEINGIPLFIKGTNVIPTSVFPENESRDKEYVAKILKTVAYSSMNMIRVWGGGIYQTDYFYDLADELGILIWQDFMFACMTYPTNPEFLDNVSNEIEYQVTRLSHHPSIALWSGNNEDETAIATGWWPELQSNFSRYVEDYLKLNKDTIKGTVKKFDPERIFVSSSPSNGDETEAEGGLATNPGDILYGDVHFYSYTANAWDQSRFPEARFVSEYGFESYSSYESLASVMSPEKLTYPISDSLEHRQHHPNGTNEMNAMINNYFGLPAKNDFNGLRKIIYLSQCLQAMAVKLETEVYLRNRNVDPFTGNKMTWGAMYWMLNDIWVATSWSSLEFGGKWKMLQYYMKDVFNPIHGQIFKRRDKDSELIQVVINNDVSHNLKFSVTVNVYQFDSFTASTVITGIFEVDSYAADVIYSLNLNQLVGNNLFCSNYNNCLVQLRYNNIPSNNSIYLSQGEDFLFLAKPKELKLKETSVNVVSVVNMNAPQMVSQNYISDNFSNRFIITLSAEHPALFVWIDFEMGSGIDGVFSSNGFMMVKPTLEVYFETNNNTLSATNIHNHLVITHLKENI